MSVRKAVNRQGANFDRTNAWCRVGQAHAALAARARKIGAKLLSGVACKNEERDRLAAPARPSAAHAGQAALKPTAYGLRAACMKTLRSLYCDKSLCLITVAASENVADNERKHAQEGSCN